MDDGYYHIQELRLLRKNFSGTLAPELGEFPYLTIIDFMWNNLSGSIPKEIGKLSSLQLLLLSGNQLSGPLPDELGFLPNLTKFQLDLNQISGSVPTTFAKLPKVQHFHMNNNSISGQLPPELSKLPMLKHFLMDNNNLSGYLPPEFSQMPSLTILQLDNSNFDNTEIPASYGNMPKLVKLSLRNCGLKGAVPDLSALPKLMYLDLSQNQLSGNLPQNKIPASITTIDLSNNTLNGSIPSGFSGLRNLQRLSFEHNSLSGIVPSNIWENMTLNSTSGLLLDFRDNLFSDIASGLNPPPNVTMRLDGNSVCQRAQLNITQFCGTVNQLPVPENVPKTANTTCPPQCQTSQYFELISTPVSPCFCAAPFGVELRLRSPSVTYFVPYIDPFRYYITSNLSLNLYQLKIDFMMWEIGPRLRMYLKFFPSDIPIFSDSEVIRISDIIAEFKIPGNDTFGPYDLLGFNFIGPYEHQSSKPGKNKGVLAGIVLGSVSCAIAIALIITFFVLRKRQRNQHKLPKDQSNSKFTIKVEGAKDFSFKELEKAANNFNTNSEIGQGGYGIVYKGVLSDGSAVAIKRALKGSLQGEKEFYTEIELLSRLHHRNLVSLVGYCNEEDEQMLVYEFMPNGSLHDLLSAKYRQPLSFKSRLYIALGAAKGILYLHTEAYPPIIHRDIKPNNILLDSNMSPKVSDFGISRLAPDTGMGHSSTQIYSTAVQGTRGYVDPDYLLTHNLTDKSDVYSLGIVFLELLTGMQPISHGRNIAYEVRGACEVGNMFSVIDKRMGTFPSQCVKRWMGMALKCTKDKKEGRPNMLEVVRELEDIIFLLPDPDKDLYTSGDLPSNESHSPASTSTIYSTRRSPYATTDFPGGDLVSGVIPTIKPR
ncbi:probable LRR receptor-like serine/threonine-protein kinase At1g06840 [Impatiens glandulifera]|uniref:probable LRR receptor-like serine/threonine-protein kinase At1g06840 n=1 Tax=Impatiens glandulifera TaxID=253017 RepID=UPI001FB17B76|nr:probable LRR receptor-like serine/threonine-protein kinase At1g06840 [Impatiens glandulifera]